MTQHYLSPEPPRPWMQEFLSAHDLHPATDADDWELFLPVRGKGLQALLEALHPQRPDQVVAAVPGCDSLVAKKSLWVNLVRSVGRKHASTVVPESFLLEHAQDRVRLDRVLAQGAPVLLKDQMRQRRRGLRIGRTPEEVARAEADGFQLAQRLVETVPLHGRVFHLRMYVVLLLQGTRLAAHRHARARCLYAAEPLRPDHIDAASRLTNGDATPPPGAPFELEELWAELERHGADRHALERSIDRRLAECVDACRARLGNVDALAANPCFQLLGADVILGRKLEPYVVEINKMPSLRPLNAADAALKHAVLADTFALAGLLGPQPASGLVALPLRAA